MAVRFAVEIRRRVRRKRSRAARQHQVNGSDTSSKRRRTETTMRTNRLHIYVHVITVTCPDTSDHVLLLSRKAVPTWSKSCAVTNFKHQEHHIQSRGRPESKHRRMIKHTYHSCVVGFDISMTLLSIQRSQFSASRRIATVLTSCRSHGRRVMAARQGVLMFDGVGSTPAVSMCGQRRLHGADSLTRRAIARVIRVDSRAASASASPSSCVSAFVHG
jgi:hypothetical protein